MKLIEPSFEIVKFEDTLEGIYKAIELAGKVSHKSEHNIKEGSAKEFVDRMIKLGHYAPLEFGTVNLGISRNFPKAHDIFTYYRNNPYSRVATYTYYFFITTNYRVIAEANRLDDLEYSCEFTEYHKKRICVKFTLPIGISREFVRHRAFSFMELSTRYVNMSGNKVGNEITFISPNFKPDFIGSPLYLEWIEALRNAEKSYNNLIKLGYKPQEARGVLPLDTKTELYMCGYIEDWKKFFELRDDKQHAHPQAYELAHPLHEEFIRLRLINN
jgi:thymidylate synthase (FAD)